MFDPSRGTLRRRKLRSVIELPTAQPQFSTPLDLSKDVALSRCLVGQKGALIRCKQRQCVIWLHTKFLWDWSLSAFFAILWGGRAGCMVIPLIKGSIQSHHEVSPPMTVIEVTTIVLGLITASLGLATAYLNFRSAEKLAKSRTQVKKRFWPWA